MAVAPDTDAGFVGHCTNGFNPIYPASSIRAEALSYNDGFG